MGRLEAASSGTWVGAFQRLPDRGGVARLLSAHKASKYRKHHVPPCETELIVRQEELYSRYSRELQRGRCRPRVLHVDQAGPSGDKNGLQTRMSAEGGEQIRNVVAHRGRAQVEFAGDLGGRLPSCQQAQDLELAFRERVGLIARQALSSLRRRRMATLPTWVDAGVDPNGSSIHPGVAARRDSGITGNRRGLMQMHLSHKSSLDD
jgi:hypothetical protein